MEYFYCYWEQLFFAALAVSEFFTASNIFQDLMSGFSITEDVCLLLDIENYDRYLTQGASFGTSCDNIPACYLAANLGILVLELMSAILTTVLPSQEAYLHLKYCVLLVLLGIPCLVFQPHADPSDTL